AVDPGFNGKIIQTGIEGIADVDIPSRIVTQEKGLVDLALTKGDFPENGPTMAADDIVRVDIAAPPVGYPIGRREALSMCNGTSSSEYGEDKGCDQGKAQ